MNFYDKIYNIGVPSLSTFHSSAFFLNAAAESQTFARAIDDRMMVSKLEASRTRIIAINARAHIGKRDKRFIQIFLKEWSMCG